VQTKARPKNHDPRSDRAIVSFQGALESESGQDGSPSVVLVSYWRPEQSHKAISEELVDSALIKMDLNYGQLKEAVQQVVHCFRAESLRQCSRIGKIAEDNGHLFVFAFDSTPGRENLVGQMGRGVVRW
jgi:hypothetical protein